MSISGVSATSSAAYIQQQLQTATAATATGTTAQTTGAQAASAQQADPTQQSGQVHHHHHHGGGGQAAQSADVNQSGTATAGGTNILDALV
jgi:hypothetical protein